MQQKVATPAHFKVGWEQNNKYRKEAVILILFNSFFVQVIPVQAGGRTARDAPLDPFHPSECREKKDVQGNSEFVKFNLSTYLTLLP